MNRLPHLFLAACFLFILPQRLPAPISEEATPSPTAKPKLKRVTESQPDRRSKSSVPASTPIPTSPKRFAGTWSGTMPEVPWGNVAVKLVVDPTETTMEWWGAGTNHGIAKAKLSANTLQAKFPAGFTTATWSVTPQPDGATAQVRLQAFMNDETAVFRRTSP